MTTEQQEESLTGAQGKRPLLMQMAENMARSVEALGPALAAVDVAVSPQLAAVMQETENTWREMEAEFGLLTSTEVSAAVGSKSPNRSWASEQRSAGRLLAINRPRGYRYPGFQVDRVHGVILPVIGRLITVAKKAGWSEASLALWLVASTGYLDDARPVDRLDRGDEVVYAAEQSFNVQW
ncbi:hypothetical protein [Arthrobacter sp. A5]|uniref:hypothetical protein n=1 Tax=Arthrobacter sp. A5 TaxID=576926 RepID=UPI003DA945D1